MASDQNNSLEQALAKTESDVEAACKAAALAGNVGSIPTRGISGVRRQESVEDGPFV